MTAYPWLWIVFTIIAAAAQTVRNAMQRELTGTLGTLGATHVRFLFGFPFALVFLAALMLWTGARLPQTGWAFWLWVLDGSAAQIAATALMLVGDGRALVRRHHRLLKTEPIQVAIFGLIFLGDVVTLPMMIAIVVATAGVLIMSTKPGGMVGGIRPTLLGPRLGRHVRAVGDRLSRRDPQSRPAELHDVRHLHARRRPGRHDDRCCRSISCCALRRDDGHHAASGDARCSPASWARSPRNSGFSPSPSPPPQACGRWRWSKSCSRSLSRALPLVSAPRRAKRSAWCSSSPASCCLILAY